MTPTRPDPHHPTSEELFAYRDGELTADRRSLIEAHVMACAQCSERLEAMSIAEAELRLKPDAVDEAYFEQMTDSVMAKIGAAETWRAAAVEPVEAAPAAGGYVDVPRVERRRPDISVEDQEPRRRLHLPWIGVGGGMAAAVAVAVVVVILFRNQQEWVRAPRPRIVGMHEMTAPAESVQSEAAPVTPPPAASSRDVRRQGARNAPQARETASPIATPGAPRQNKVQAARGDQKVALGTLQSGAAAAKDEAMQERSAKASAGLAAPSAQAPEPMALKKSAAMSEEGTPGSPAAGVLRAHGLPPIWNPSVTPDQVVRAERDLRYLYQTGGAGADSARIRLYLAEAERARLTDPNNIDAIESISHHYRRAISLAHGDAALAATASRRLEEFEQEMARARAAQPH